MHKSLPCSKGTHIASFQHCSIVWSMFHFSSLVMLCLFTSVFCLSLAPAITKCTTGWKLLLLVELVLYWFIFHSKVRKWILLHIYVYLPYVCACVCVCMRVCVYVCMYVCACMRACVCAQCQSNIVQQPSLKHCNCYYIKLTNFRQHKETAWIEKQLLCTSSTLEPVGTTSVCFQVFSSLPTNHIYFIFLLSILDAWKYFKIFKCLVLSDQIWCSLWLIIPVILYGTVDIWKSRENTFKCLKQQHNLWNG